MECYVCSREHDSKQLPFLCSVDARNRLYEGRVNSLQIQLENEKLKEDISQLSDEMAPDSADAATAQRQALEVDADEILAAAKRLRTDIKAARAEIQARKLALSKRRSDLASVSSGLADRRAKQRQEVVKTAQSLSQQWSKSADDMAGTRAFLCKEAVRLYGLKRFRKGGAGRYEYHLAKLPIVDLGNMESSTPDAISTSLAHIAHIIVLVAHYLSIRLPAEITLPHRDYPRPTIFNLATSYQHEEVSFPVSLSSSTGLSEPKTSELHSTPRPRPLYVDKPLSRLAREDPSTYSFFLEGVTLLAYDIAWLCCSQGAFYGDKGSLDDICNMGKNMYNLLISPSLQGPSNMPSHQPHGGSDNTSTPQDWVGRYSHGTMYYPLSGVDGTELIKSFKLPSPMKLADKLKKKLLGDAPAADWEVLDTDAWREEESHNATVAQSPKEATRSPLRSDSKGWMKVKSR